MLTVDIAAKYYDYQVWQKELKNRIKNIKSEHTSDRLNENSTEDA